MLSLNLRGCSDAELDAWLKTLNRRSVQEMPTDRLLDILHTAVALKDKRNYSLWQIQEYVRETWGVEP
jgi:hypothetical protein